MLNPKFEIVSKLVFKTSFFTLHYNSHDNQGKSMVIQYSGPNNLQWINSTSYQGALANNPLWESQTAYYNNECHTQLAWLLQIHRPCQAGSSSPYTPLSQAPSPPCVPL
jgi:penicillin V acylase-like amidase (Ntn superfamily)